MLKTSLEVAPTTASNSDLLFSHGAITVFPSSLSLFNQSTAFFIT